MRIDLAKIPVFLFLRSWEYSSPSSPSRILPWKSNPKYSKRLRNI